MVLRNRYPDADILAQRGHWDDATRRVVLDRVHNVPPFRYFEPRLRAALEALCACVVPQTHRPPARRIPIAQWVDAHCAQGHMDGFRFDDMPPTELAWRWGLEGLTQTAQALFGERATFSGELEQAQQHQVLKAVRAGDPPGAVWQRMPARRWWVYVATRQITAIYYAHPFAWDEIGFGGPAYPRGYFALNFGAPEPWEAREAGDDGQPSRRPRWRFP
ncbi:MAG: gluconate 2-dehydrogenase subunit 3 family protein [Chloroflexi bacterium]|nr:gluconate 2-dehydrogenase subunit 3 family protein [Chloroflexota bacterium]